MFDDEVEFGISGEVLSICEFVDQNAVDLVIGNDEIEADCQDIQIFRKIIFN